MRFLIYFVMLLGCDHGDHHNAVTSQTFSLSSQESFVVSADSSEEGSTYILPGEIVFTAPGETGFVELCHYPDEFLMSTGGFLARKGDRGFRVSDPMGQNAIILGATQEYGYVSSVRVSNSDVPRDLWLYSSGRLRITAPETDGTLEVILNGRSVRIPFDEVSQ